MSVNQNVADIVHVLKSNGQTPTKELCRLTKLSPDQVRRALKQAPVRSPKRGVWELKGVSKPVGSSKLTITQVAEDAILKGKSNEQVLALLTEKIPGFDPVSKKSYPAWFRNRLRKEGELPAQKTRRK